jgi:hypothetical protein
MAVGDGLSGAAAQAAGNGATPGAGNQAVPLAE